MHLIVDGVCRNIELLTSVEALEKWLIDTVAFIGMKVIGGPWVVDYRPEGNESEKGLSGVIILAESSIVVHTYPKYNWAYTDIFSCRSFSFEEVEGLVTKSFGIDNPKVYSMRRSHGQQVE